MAAQQLVILAVPFIFRVSLVGFQQDADIEMLDGCILQALKVLRARVGAAAKPGVNAIDDLAQLELMLQEVNAFQDLLLSDRVGRQLGWNAAPVRVSLSALLGEWLGFCHPHRDGHHVGDGQVMAIDDHRGTGAQAVLEPRPFGIGGIGMRGYYVWEDHCTAHIGDNDA